MQLYDLKEIEERIILVGVQETLGDDIEDSIAELGELAKTAGAKVVGTLIQKREKIHSGTYIGKGKIEEVKALILESDATGILCDDELSPAQMNNLQQQLDCKVMDRTLVILDIFAKRATTREGILQVELAQLKYRAARLTGLGSSLSRLGGGIGTRGPGEKKLEMDRRLIRTRISHLKKELEDVQRHRELVREKRKKSNVKIAALIGYTCAGKSSCESYLTQAEILADDMVFSTLDTTTRVLKLDGRQEILLTDTVGFIRKLPHHLVEAFKGTLEEAKYADILIHVVDASNPQMEKQIHVVYETLKQLKVENKPIITVFNKQDQVAQKRNFKDFQADYSILASAKTGQGMEEIKVVLQEILRKQKIYIERLYPYSEAGLVQLIKKYGELSEEDYREDGIFIKAFVPKEIYDRV